MGMRRQGVRLTKSGGGFIEQVIRPTGLVDPQVEIRPVKGQVDAAGGNSRGADAQ